MLKIYPAIVFSVVLMSVAGVRIAPDQLHTRSYSAGGLKARALVVSCMDFRLINKVRDMMTQRGYSDNYDLFILAGASLGYVQKKLPNWTGILHDHLHYAVSLHHVKEVIFVDHLDCGLYKQQYGALKGQQELEKHRVNLREAKALLAKHYPKIKFYGSVMDLDGKVVYAIE